ncbi:HAD family hydrolase [Actinocatenispora rupis]|uniref:Haloacid dehalogenase n=1 Tax=Actinocatenispora rupis TaxID=519421 RepID=A0A8J3N9S9_9ACTN|nr:HAD family hydrolase [Actinocatenispora rupis]GID11644.1 haloacid dehalogenase [Actinocatenispora rupis]
MTRAILFDLFGTLVPGDTNAERDETSRRIAAVLGVDPTRFAAEVRASRRDRFTGHLGDIPETVRTLAERVGGNPTPAAVDSAVRQRLALTRRQLVPGPGVLDALDRLRGDGWRLALVTNCSAETAQLWRETEFVTRFELAVFSSTLGHAKPDPRAYLAAVVALNLPPASCAFVGDGASGELPGAVALGLPTVLAATPLADPDVDTADWAGPRITSLSELPALLADLVPDQAD